jgi:DNA-binding NarL/FixJ family response regulator
MQPVDRPNTHSEPASPDDSRDRKLTVMVVDDHPAVRAGVSRLLAEEPDMDVVKEAASATQAIHAAAGIDVAVVDYHLSDSNGLWVTSCLRRLQAAPRVLLYSAFSDGALAIAAVIAGADGLLSKSAVGEELCLAVRRVARGTRYLPRVSMPIADAMGAQVEARLRPAFGMLVQGISTDQILEALQISSRQLDAARAAILSTLAPAATRDQGARTSRAVFHYERPRDREYGQVQPATAP